MTSIFTLSIHPIQLFAMHIYLSYTIHLLSGCTEILTLMTHISLAPFGMILLLHLYLGSGHAPQPTPSLAHEGVQLNLTPIGFLLGVYEGASIH
jgi:hypothetical protein